MHILNKWIPLYHCKKRGKGWQRSHLKHSKIPREKKGAQQWTSPISHHPPPTAILGVFFPQGNLAFLGHGNILDALIQRCCWVRLEITPRSSSTKSILICRRWPKVHHKDWRVHEDFWKPTILISWDFPSIVEPSIVKPSLEIFWISRWKPTSLPFGWQLFFRCFRRSQIESDDLRGPRRSRAPLAVALETCGGWQWGHKRFVKVSLIPTIGGSEIRQTHQLRER